MNKIIQYLKYMRFYTLYLFRWIYPINKYRFLFISMSGNSYGGNPKAFADYLQNSNSGIKIIWVKSKSFRNEKSNTKFVELYTWKYYFYLLTSKVLLSDQRLYKSMVPVKRRGQFYIQFWHGTALKKIEADMPDLTESYKQMAIRDSNMIDLFVSGSSFMTKIYRDSFWYTGEMLEVGTPRNDIFFSNQLLPIKEKVQRFYNIKNKRIILYAPTFRAKNSLSAYTIDLATIYDKFDINDWVVIVRLHPNLMGSISAQAFNKQFPNSIDGSAYPDMQELLCAADMLITDYSSSMFDYMYTSRPCIIYAPDIATYDRGFYFSIRNLPFPIVENNNELRSALSNIETINYSSFLKSIGSHEKGTASKQIYEYIQKNIL